MGFIAEYLLKHVFGERSKCSGSQAHISSIQLLFVINAGHSDVTLTAHGEVVGVAGDE